MAGWEAQARNKRMGPKTDLVTFEKDDGGKYFIRPQKLSIEAQSELKALRSEAAAKISPSAQRALREAQEQWRESGGGEDDPSFAEIQALLTDEQWGLITSTLDVMNNQAPIIKLYLLHGIGEHNFDGPDGKIMTLDEALVDAWMEHEALAQEMVGIIEAWNRPLAGGSAETLPTVASGPTEGNSSK
jgi:hypothetical protein